VDYLPSKEKFPEIFKFLIIIMFPIEQKTV